MNLFSKNPDIRNVDSEHVETVVLHDFENEHCLTIGNAKEL